MVLVFVGTLAQTRLGVWQAVDTWLRAWVAMVDLGLFCPPQSVTTPRGDAAPPAE